MPDADPSETNGQPAYSPIKDESPATARPSGCYQLQTWKPIHDQILALHLAGYQNKSIAARLDLTPQTVSNVLCTDKAKRAIAEHAGRIFKSYREDIEDRMVALGVQAIENIGQTVNSEFEPDTQAKRHQDSVSFSVLDRIGVGVQDDGEKGVNIQLSKEASGRIAKALEESREAQRLIDEAEEAEVVEEGST